MEQAPKIEGNRSQNKIPEFIRNNLKLKNLLKILVLTGGLLLGVNKAGAQDGTNIENENTTLNVENSRNGNPTPESYDLSSKQDLSIYGRKFETDQKGLLDYTIGLVRQARAELLASNQDTSSTKKLINEYDKFLENPSLNFDTLGTVVFGKQDFERNKKIFENYDRRILKMADHVKSPEYLKKLMIEFGISEEEAKKHQAIRLGNILNGTYYLDDEANANFAEFYGSTFHVLLNSDTSDYKAEHEILGHKSTVGNKGIPENTKRILKDSYKDYNSNNNPAFQFKYPFANDSIEKEYFKNPTERLSRKQALDIEMEDLGIKLYKDKFTPKHFKKLMEFYRAGKLSYGADQFIETTKPEDFEKIFNEIADSTEVDNSKEDKA